MVCYFGIQNKNELNFVYFLVLIRCCSYWSLINPYVLDQYHWLINQLNHTLRWTQVICIENTNGTLCPSQPQSQITIWALHNLIGTIAVYRLDEQVCESYLYSANAEEWCISLDGGGDDDESGVSVTLYRLVTKVSHPRRNARSKVLKGIEWIINTGDQENIEIDFQNGLQS